MTARMADGSSGVPVESVEAVACTIPTDAPESDGTIEWDATTIVVVTARAGGRTGIGYTYGAGACAELVRSHLAGVACGRDALAPGAVYVAAVAAVRNIGRPGVASMAISALDVALWDLKARLLDVSMAVLLGGARQAVPVYGSGGFTSYDDAQLAGQLAGWVEQGIPRVKMKVGRHPGRDEHRVAVARRAIGDSVELYVDANGAYDRAGALGWAERYGGAGVAWLEEPVSSDDLEGLRLVRDRAPGGLEVAAGEYGYDTGYFRRMLAAGAVDCLQADVTRCGGVTGMLGAGAVAESFGVDLSAHCAPQVSAQVGTAVARLRHLEYFHDHVRIEHLLFDGVVEPEPGGLLRPDRSRPGLGIELKEAEVERWAA
jgi:L-alanine-DL-glutamate epimerase-like enolase superfamily enzyme